MAGESLPRVGFLGAGKMATALARGWLTAGLVTAEDDISARLKAKLASGLSVANAAP